MHEQGYLLINPLFTLDEMEEVDTCLNSEFTASTRLALDNTVIREFGVALLKKVASHIPAVANYKPVSCHYFNKCKETNWMVPFHRDEYFLFDEKINHPHVTDWCYKEERLFGRIALGQLHRLIAVRLAIDPVDLDNGPLRVLPKSHLYLGSEVPSTVGERSIIQNIGDALIMYPSLFHASSKSVTGRSRRILHYAFIDKNFFNPSA